MVGVLALNLFEKVRRLTILVKGYIDIVNFFFIKKMYLVRRKNIENRENIGHKFNASQKICKHLRLII